MSARTRSYQRVPREETALAGAVSAGAGAGLQSQRRVDPTCSSFDDDESDAEDDDSLAARAGGDDDSSSFLGDGEEHPAVRKKLRERSRRAALWSTKLHAFLWVAAAGCTAYAIDFFRVIFTDPRVKRGYFRVALVCMGINICITAYLAIYLPYIKKMRLEWSVYCPRMIPAATVVGVLGTLCFLCAFWPVWGLLTPGLLALFFIGSLMTAHFLPSI